MFPAAHTLRLLSALFKVRGQKSAERKGSVWLVKLIRAQRCAGAHCGETTCFYGWSEEEMEGFHLGRVRRKKRTKLQSCDFYILEDKVQKKRVNHTLQNSAIKFILGHKHQL